MSDPTVANTILKQLGGTGRLAVLIGAKKFGYTDNSVLVTWPLTAKNKARHVRITLEPTDTYTVEFLSLHGKTVSIHRDIYCEDLTPLFERETGLYLRSIPVSRVNQRTT